MEMAPCDKCGALRQKWRICTCHFVMHPSKKLHPYRTIFDKVVRSATKMAHVGKCGALRQTRCICVSALKTVFIYRNQHLHSPLFIKINNLANLQMRGTRRRSSCILLSKAIEPGCRCLEASLRAEQNLEKMHLFPGRATCEPSTPRDSNLDTARARDVINTLRKFQPNRPHRLTCARRQSTPLHGANTQKHIQSFISQIV